MKKQYTAPEVEINEVDSSEIICTSASFGEGTTSTMHSKERRVESQDNWGDLWNK